MRNSPVIAGLAVAVALSWAVNANGQSQGTDDEQEPAETDVSAPADAAAPTEIPDELFEDRVMDEITVTVGPQGQSAYEMEMERLARMRETIYADKLLRERAEEEVTWRKADPDLDKPESRIKWGYSPQAEQRMRRENDFINDLPFEQTKPATLFRAEF